MLIEAKNISFAYARSEPVLDCVSLAIEAGERVALVGPSGCGKSTLSLILAGYLRARSGTVLLKGNALPKKGYCPVQLIYQHPEKALNPRRKQRFSLYEAWTPNEEFLDAIGIEEEWLDRYPSELSGGELQRFCIARALAPETELLIADEMTTMLDVITQAQIWELTLRQVEQRNLGLLVITHSPELAERICTRVLRFEELSSHNATA